MNYRALLDAVVHNAFEWEQLSWTVIVGNESGPAATGIKSEVGSREVSAICKTRDFLGAESTYLVPVTKEIRLLVSAGLIP